MKCTTFEHHLQAALDGHQLRLDDDCQAHLHTCDTCRMSLAGFERLISGIEASRQQVPHVKLADRVLTALATGNPSLASASALSPKSNRSTIAAYWGAAAVAACLGGLVLFSGESAAPTHLASVPTVSPANQDVARASQVTPSATPTSPADHQETVVERAGTIYVSLAGNATDALSGAALAVLPVARPNPMSAPPASDEGFWEQVGRRVESGLEQSLTLLWDHRG